MAEKRLAERLDAGERSVERAARCLLDGGLVAFPTETVYGLGARADRSDAVRAIFEAKGRPSTNPLIVHVASTERARELAASWPAAAEALGRAFWPGPLTLVVTARDRAVAPEVMAGGTTVAIRVPEHPVARALLAAAGVPVAAPSANRSTTVSSTTADHVAKTLGDRVDMILDGGSSGRGIESTIVDVTRVPPVVLRHGALSMDALARITSVADGTDRVEDETSTAAAPGGFARHYAPCAKLVLVDSNEVAAEVARRRASGEKVGSIERSPGSVEMPPREILAANPADFAAGLYAALHRLDDAGCTVIVAAKPPPGPEWHAVRDRLTRGSA